MSPLAESRARGVPAITAFALALLLSPCSLPQQANTQKPPAVQASPAPSADRLGARRGADSHWWIRVRGDARAPVFAEDGVLKKELPRVPRLSELSPDGSRLLEVRFADGASDIFVADADGSHARRVARGVNPQDDAHWSHDGTRILYASSRGGYHVFEADARGNVLRKFARVDGVVSKPAYTQDGRVSYLLGQTLTEQRHPSSDNFVTSPKLSPSSLVVADATAERILVDGRPLSSYAWEPSGQRLAFGTYADAGLIVVRDLAGGTERVVKLSDIDKRLDGFVAYDIRWRPDGGAVAFTLSFTGGRGQGDKESLFGERQLFVLYPDGHATWFDVGKEYSIFDWIPADGLPE